MNNWQKILFSFGIAAPIIIEGLGLPLNRAISYYFILIAPFILFALANAHRTLNIPLWSAILYLSFLIFSIVGTFFSLNVQVSFEYVLLYTAYFLIFIYSYNNPWISRVIPQVIAFITIIFILYAAYFYVAFPNNLTISPFIEGYNLIAAKYRGHNQLADFLVLPLAIGFYFLFHKKHTKLAIGAIVVLLPPFIFSYSRSAYAALGVVLTMLALPYIKKQSSRLKRRLVAGAVILFFIIALGVNFSVSRETKNIPPFSYIYRILPKQNTYLHKDLIGRRDQYFTEGLSALKKYWLFGVGAGNFSVPSIRYTPEPFVWTETSTSIFFDFLVEQGVVTTVLLLLFILSIFKYASYGSLLFFLVLALLVNFQSNYLYRFYSIFFLFFILAGQVLAHGKKHKKFALSSRLFSAVSAVLLLISYALVSHRLLLKARLIAPARLLYPLSREVYQPFIEQEVRRGNYKNALITLRLYEGLFQGVPGVFIYSGSLHERYGDKQTALIKYYHAYQWHRYEGLYLYQKIYALEHIVNGTPSARRFLKQYINNIRKLPNSPTKAFLLKNVKQFCTEKNLRDCVL